MVLFKVLSIDGGGSKGAISLAFLLSIEKKTGKNISELFDLFVGTSAGSIIVSSIVLKNPDGSPKFKNCQEILDTFIGNIKDIFYQSWSRYFFTLNGLIGPKYESSSEFKVLDNIFGDIYMPNNLIITSNTIDPCIGYFEFSNTDTQENKYKIVDAIMASSAAPTYYGVHTINLNSVNTDFIDGGISANNPSMVGYASSIDKGFTNDQILIVSIGTGYNTLKESDYCDKGGKVQWASPISDNMIASNSDFIDYQLKKILSPNNYFRLNVPLNCDKMDITDKNLLYGMVNNTLKYIETNIEINEKICKLSDILQISSTERAT